MGIPNNSYEFDLAAFRPVGEHLNDTDVSSATALTPPATADKLLIQALAQNVRLTLGGTTPTAALGFQLKAGDPPVLIHIGEGVEVSVIEETSGGIVQYQWGR